MVHRDNCPVCYSADLTHKMTCSDHFKSGEEFSVAECRVCGFTFTQDHPGEQDLGRYYESSEYISHSDTSRGLVNKIYRLVRALMLRKKRALVIRETGLKTGSILDIGTGTGHFAAEMKTAGWTVAGTEINDHARKSSSERSGIQILPPEGMTSLSSESFDCITLWHVLEHFSDLNMYIREIKRLLKKGGICIIALPNASSFDALHYKRHWAAYDVPRHLWHFNPDTLGFLFESRGFRMKSIIPLPLDVFYISILSERYKGNSFPFIRGMLKGAFFAVKASFDKRKTSSLIYVLKK